MSAVRRGPLQLTSDLQLAPPDPYLYNMLPVTTGCGIGSHVIYWLLQLPGIHIEGKVGNHIV